MRGRSFVGPLAALLSFTLACGGRAALQDPLARVPTHVSPDEIEPPPLREQWRWTPTREAATRATNLTPEQERALGERERVLRPPAVGTEAVVVATAAGLRAHRAADGAVLWRAALASPVVVGPLAAGEAAVVGTAAGDWYWFDQRDGRVLAGWPAPTVPDDAIAAGGRVVAVFDGTAVALAIGDGGETTRVTPTWQTPLGAEGDDEAGWHLAVSEDGASVYATTSSAVVALTADSGRRRWRRSGLRLRPLRASSGRGRVFVVGADSVPLALDADDGDRAWRGTRVGSLVTAAPAYADGVVWIAGLEAALHGYSAANGAHLFRVPLSSRCRVDLARYERWIVAGPRAGPWTLVRAPLRPASPSDPGRPVVLTVAADEEIDLPGTAGPIGIAVADAGGTLRLLRPGPGPTGGPEAGAAAEQPPAHSRRPQGVKPPAPSS